MPWHHAIGACYWALVEANGQDAIDAALGDPEAEQRVAQERLESIMMAGGDV